MDTEFISTIRAAIKANDISKVEGLIGNDKKKLNTVFVFGSWLHEAAKLGYVELAEKLLDMGIDTNLEARSFKGNAISSAASKGQIEMIKYLLSRGLVYDISNEDANPLFRAIASNNVETVKFLLNDGIDVNVNYSDDDDPWTALQVAQNCGNPEIIKLITAAMKGKETIDMTVFLEKQVGEIQATIENIPIIDNKTMKLQLVKPYDVSEYEIFITDGLRQFTLSDQKQIELMIKVPNGWSEILLANQKDKTSDVHWIYKWLIYLSYLPIKNNSTVADGLIIPLSKPIFQGTEMTSFLYTVTDEFNDGAINIEGSIVNVYQIIPLYEEEYKLSVKEGVQSLIRSLKEHPELTIVDWKRKML